MSPHSFGGRARQYQPVTRERPPRAPAAIFPFSCFTEAFSKADGAGWGPGIAWDQEETDNYTIGNEGGADDSAHPGSANAEGRTPSLGSVDQAVSVTLASLSIVSQRWSIELYARVTTLDAGRQHYAAVFEGVTNVSLARTKYYKYVAGSFSAIGSPTSISVPSPGDVLAFEVVGTALTTQINGVTVKTTTDASITTGDRAGMFLGWNDVGNSLTVDAFEACLA